jgi:hypothetical protein
LALKSKGWILLQQVECISVFSLQHRLSNPLAPRGLSLTLPQTSTHSVFENLSPDLEDQMLRFLIGIVSCVAMLVAQVPSGFAQQAVSPVQPAAMGPAQDATPSPAILEAFKAYPKGGEELSKVIEDLIVSDPQLAPGLARHLQSAAGLNKVQKQAAFRGLAAALNRLQIRAADLPVFKAPPAAQPVVEEFPWWPVVLGALLVGGGIAALVLCCEDEPFFGAGGEPVSP